MLHLCRNPDLDPDAWGGFTSYQQLDKFPTVLCARDSLEADLAAHDVLGWGFYSFADAVTARPVSPVGSPRSRFALVCWFCTQGEDSPCPGLPGCPGRPGTKATRERSHGE
jgi:hypothetical protein